MTRMRPGLSTVRVNCGTAIVGIPPQVTDELLASWRLGIDAFILSGFPYLEEGFRVSQALMSRLRAAMAEAAVDQGEAAAVV